MGSLRLTPAPSGLSRVIERSPVHVWKMSIRKVEPSIGLTASYSRIGVGSEPGVPGKIFRVGGSSPTRFTGDPDAMAMNSLAVTLSGNSMAPWIRVLGSRTFGP